MPNIVVAGRSETTLQVSTSELMGYDICLRAEYEDGTIVKSDITPFPHRKEVCVV